MPNYKATILHIVNNYSGAARYAEEMMVHSPLAPEFQFVYIYLSHESVMELTVKEQGQYIVVLFPKLELRIPNERFDFLQFMVDVLSPYIIFCDRIIVHDNGHMALNKGLFKMNRQKFRYIQTVHFLPLGQQAIEQISDEFDYTICVTEYARDKVMGRVKDASLIYNGVAQKRTKESKKEIRDRYGFDSNELLLLYVGRIESAKGIFLLAEQFCSMNIPDVRLVVVGAGDYGALLAAARKSPTRVTLLGEIPNTEVRALIKACDVGVLPSLNEQCSYVALEMMSCGIPIIATAVRGMGELFAGKDIALTVTVEYRQDAPYIDVESLKDCINRSVSDENLRAYLGKKAQADWHKNYRSKRMFVQTLDVYRKINKSFI